MNREDKKKETYNRIMDSARKLFAEHGYEATTVEQITKQANVAKGTFFNYFGSKEDILCDMQSFWAVGEIKKLYGKTGPFVPKLMALLLDIVAKLDFSRPLARTMFQSAFGSAKSLAFQQTMFRELIEQITPIMAAGQANGEFTKRIPPEQLAYLAVQTFFGVLSFWSMEMGDDSLTEQLVMAFELFFAGIDE